MREKYKPVITERKNIGNTPKLAYFLKAPIKTYFTRDRLGQLKPDSSKTTRVEMSLICDLVFLKELRFFLRIDFPRVRLKFGLFSLRMPEFKCGKDSIQIPARMIHIGIVNKDQLFRYSSFEPIYISQ